MFIIQILTVILSFYFQGKPLMARIRSNDDVNRENDFVEEVYFLVNALGFGYADADTDVE